MSNLSRDIKKICRERSRAKSSQGIRRLQSTCTATIVLAAGLSTQATFAAELPIPCLAGNCGANAPLTWVTTTDGISGGATSVLSGNSLTINQTVDKAIYNWKSFNISADGTVTFQQPNSTSVALNRIFQGDPVRILGSLNANGVVYLINKNGILFGQGSQVNVHGLVATSLDIAPEAIDGFDTAASAAVPAFRSFKDANGVSLLSGDVAVQQGATIRADQGQVMLFAPHVSNEGSISADGGQVILAAGDSIYLVPNNDANLRGLLVEVGAGGVVTNGSVTSAATDIGSISAARGNVTMVGAIVNQLGRVSATTSVQENGSVRLLARDGGSLIINGGSPASLFANEGTLTLGSNSVTEVQLDTSSEKKAVDVTAQPRSLVELDGRTVSLLSGSQIVAPSGNVNITARSNTQTPLTNFPVDPGGGRLIVEQGASIDVSGASIEKPMESNVLAVELRGSQLADSPQQRDGVLRGTTVYVDIRQSGTRSDGSTWVGSPIGDLKGDIDGIQKTVSERSLTGGQISLVSDGAALLYGGSTLNVSGGSISYQPGFIATSQVLGADGKTYDISTTDRDRQYLAGYGAATVVHSKWGITENFSGFGLSTVARFEQGYVEGKDAGTVTIIAPKVALDGGIVANVAIDRYQRATPTAIPADALYRSYAEQPLSGQLVLGNPLGATNRDNNPNYVLDSVTFDNTLSLSKLTNSSGGVFDPVNDALPDSLATLQLRPDLLGANRVGQLAIYANNTILVPTDTSLSLPIAGSINLTAGIVDIQGRVTIPSGSFTASARPTTAVPIISASSRLSFAPDATIDVAGRWVNDLSADSLTPTFDPLSLVGGNVTLSTLSGAQLDLQQGSVIDVSAGAQLTSAGKVNTGRGGVVSISASHSVDAKAVPVKIGSNFRAFAVSNGGQLKIEANAICIADVDCSGDATGELWVRPDVYAANGFSQVTLATNLGGLEVLPATLIQPRQVSYRLDDSVSAVQSGKLLSAFATIATLPDYLRKPFNLSLTVNPSAVEPFTSSTFNAAGKLTIGHDAIIELDPLAKLTLGASSSIVVDGRLAAPSGSISLSLGNGLPVLEFLPNQGIWLDSAAVLDVKGNALVLTDDLGLRTGTVRDGGSISITAQRGYIVTMPTSRIDISGTTAELNVGLVTQKSNPPLTQVASSGGHLTLAAAEGMLLNGSIDAHAGNDTSIAGGALTLTIDGNNRGVDPTNDISKPLLPMASREIRFVDDMPIVVGASQNVPALYNGVAAVSSVRINSAGFSSLDFSAVNLIDKSDKGESLFGPTAKVSFSQDTNLSVLGSIRINAPKIVGADNIAVNLSAAYVGLGYDPKLQTGFDAAIGTANLNVKGQLIEFIGGFGLDKFGSSTFSSAGDIRFRGVQATDSITSATPLVGVLNASGSVSFNAQQLYPTTLSQFSIAMAASGNRLSISHTPGSPGAVLSAGGELTFTADDIVQGGSVLAPFGHLEFDAGTLAFAGGSVTSTSGTHSLIPFGTTQAGVDWTYVLPNGQTLVYSTSDGPPAKKIVLHADSIDIRNGATVDLTGGGDLQAFEWSPGVLGKYDVLSNDYNPLQFAILPSLNLAYSPYDPAASVGFSRTVGSSVYLSGFGDLPAGVYAMLPARYALLPGAYLVRPVSGYTDISADTTYTRLDGYTAVAGYQIQAGTSIRDARTSAFEIIPGSAVYKLAQYDIHTANEFFVAAADKAATAAAGLPRDGGQLQLIAGSQLNFDGRLLAAPDANGRGAQVDISADRLVVVDGTKNIDPSVVSLNVAQLNALGAESLLLGGLRTNSQGVTSIDTKASSVSVDDGVQLTGRDLLLAAQDHLTIANGARIEASGAAVSSPSEIDLTGSGALLRVSTGSLPDKVQRNAPAASGGSLSIAAGATIAATGSALVENSGNADVRADYDLKGGSLAFSVGALALGSAGSEVGGLVLSPTELSALNLQTLSLSSASSIDVYGAISLAAAGTLKLDTPTIRAATSEAAAVFSAKNLFLGNTHPVTAPTSIGAPSLLGELTLSSENLALTGGSVALNNFSATNLTATTELHVAGTGALSVDGPMQITTPIVTTSNGIDFAVTADSLVLASITSTQTSPAADIGVGGKLSFSARSIDLATQFKMPSGIVDLLANGNSSTDGISLSTGANVDVSGMTRVFDGQVIASPGGQISLESRSGSVTIADTASIDVSGADAQSRAGAIHVLAVNGEASINGTLSGIGGPASDGGKFLVDANKLPDLTSLNTRLNSGGFNGARSFHQRGPGDLVLSSDSSGAIRAATVSISADHGALSINGTIDASGAAGNSVDLSARDRLLVNGTILAGATNAADNGGAVRLASDQAGVWLSDAAVIDVSGKENGGVVHVRAPQTAFTTLADSDSSNDQLHVGNAIRGASEISFEAFQRYTETDGVLTAADVSTTSQRFIDAAAFMSGSSSMLAGLGYGNSSIATVLPGIEIDSDTIDSVTKGNLSLTSEWNLANWRFNGAPGVLTLRAAGDLLISKSLSDGFAAVTGVGAFVLPDAPDRSWSYRLIAGADLLASNPLAVAAAGTTAHSVVISGGTISAGTKAPIPVMVRTGTGDIDVAASGNLEFKNRASVLYTAGLNSQEGIPLPALGTNLALYPDSGGDIRVNVGGNILGATTNQLVTSWLWRTGQGNDQLSVQPRPSPTGWNVNYQWFEGNIGALAGGNITVKAAGDIQNLSTSIASIGRQVGSASSVAASVVDITGGGRLDIESNGSITGGSYYVGQGTGTITASDRFGLATGSTTGAAPIVAIGDTQFDISARSGVLLETVVTPFLLPQGQSQAVPATTASYFSTYSNRSSIGLFSSAGAVGLRNNVDALKSALGTSMNLSTQQLGLGVYPGTLRAISFSSDLSVSGSTTNMVLWPAPRGQLELFAYSDLNLRTATKMSMADIDPSIFGVDHAERTLLPLTGFLYAAPRLAHTPIHSAEFSVDQQADLEPIRLVALNGDVAMGASAGFVYLPKPIHVVAGGDVVNFNANVEQFDDSNLSVISAGGSFLYPASRDDSGRLNTINSGLQIEGPGRLLIQAGGDIDLGTSTGIISIGNQNNSLLSSRGADISLLAGVKPDQTLYDGFAQHYFTPAVPTDADVVQYVESITGEQNLSKDQAQMRLDSLLQYRQDLIAYVEKLTGKSDLTDAQALQNFEQFSSDRQRAFIEPIMFNELRLSGRSAAAPGSRHDDFSRGYTALEALFPGSGAGANQQNPYKGDIRLYFSRVYTTGGGNISFAAPGGSINVGLATPPSAFGIGKLPSELGIVAQGVGDISAMSYGDFLVNESRVFAADGGDILAWSTQGNIDAGRGAKTAISAPKPTTTIGPDGLPITVFPAALTGSGIQAIATSNGTEPGSVDLYAPRGVVNAGDAGIVAGNLTIAATAVLGADNIKVSGVSVGVPVDAGGLGASLASVSSTASSASNAASMTADTSSKKEDKSAPQADAALSWLEVFVVGLGEDNCKQDDVECLKKQK